MPNTTNFNWPTPADTDLVKDGAAAIRNLGDGVDTSLVDLKGGTTGQVLSKTSNTDMDFTWVAQDDTDAIQSSIIAAKGDLIVGTANDTAGILSVGTDGYTLVADSVETTGLKWVAPAGGGKVLQVVEGSTTTNATNSTATPADTNLTASITPSSTASKVLVLFNQNGCFKGLGATNSLVIRLLRSATQLTQQVNGNGNGTNTFLGSYSNAYLDSPNTTSSTTYKTQFLSSDNSSAVEVQATTAGYASRSTIILLEIGA